MGCRSRRPWASDGVRRDAGSVIATAVQVPAFGARSEMLSHKPIPAVSARSIGVLRMQSRDGTVPGGRTAPRRHGFRGLRDAD